TSTADFNDIYFVSNTVGIIVGSKGNIFKTTTGGASLTTQEIEKLNFTFYPNPSTSFIYINGDFDENLQLKIYNTSGQILIEQSVQGNSVLVNHDLPSGMYLLQMSSNEKVGSSVFVVE
ncbi:T9SS C-terminal target domain-containing protein, partial [bacterium]|nr:T9SS C-terminal target domain-containing protein [bacterium]